jgi:16S rRNA (guanine(527)-N(7))-methyltransferase RsmG
MFKELLAAEFAPYTALSGEQLNQLESHYNSLTRWNERLNLTRIQDLSDSVRFHYCESLFLALFLPPGPLRIVDVGSGAGFPGIPVAVLRPECEITLVESHQRKAVFLREATRELENIRVMAKRAEDICGEFEWLISRAVAPSAVLALNISRDVALLICEEDAAHLSGTAKVIPWGNQRLLFHVKRPDDKFHVEPTRSTC